MRFCIVIFLFNFLIFRLLFFWWTNVLRNCKIIFVTVELKETNYKAKRAVGEKVDWGCQNDKNILYKNFLSVLPLPSPFCLLGEVWSKVWDILNWKFHLLRCHLSWIAKYFFKLSTNCCLTLTKLFRIFKRILFEPGCLSSVRFTG